LLAFNQRVYIADAVRSALSQDCEPITVLLSDDASTDGTFEVIERTVAGYDGPHRVVLNRNPTNHGLAAHINSAMNRIDTDIVVAAAGDDISLPFRVSRILASFQNERALLVHSGAKLIDADGQPVAPFTRDAQEGQRRLLDPQQAATNMSLHVGATAAWRKELFDRFGPIADGCYEDLVLGFRASLERAAVCIDEPLVEYRLGVGMAQTDEWKLDRQAWITNRKAQLKRQDAILEQRLADVLRSSHPDREGISRILRKALRDNTLRRSAYEVSTFSHLLRNKGRLVTAFRCLLSEKGRHAKAARRRPASS